MKKMARAVLAGVFAIGLSASAVPAHAAEGYGVTVEVSISDVTQVGGNRISVRAKAQTSEGDAVNCAWKVSFQGASAPFVNGPNPDTGSGSTFNRIYTTDEVPNTKRGSATASCTYDDADTAFASALQTASATGGVTLLPRDGDDDDSDDSDDGGDSDDSDSDDSDDNDDNGGLPNTGGERLLWLLIGLALVAGGTTVIVSSRNRDSTA